MVVTPNTHEAHQALGSRWPRFHMVTILKRLAFIAGTPCDCEGCDGKAVMRGAINVWGTVGQVDLCEGHREWDGRACDGLPTGPPK